MTPRCELIEANFEELAALKERAQPRSGHADFLRFNAIHDSLPGDLTFIDRDGVSRGQANTVFQAFRSALLVTRFGSWIECLVLQLYAREMQRESL